MNGMMSEDGFSQKWLVHDGLDEEQTQEMELLLDTVSNTEAGVSDEVLEQVRRFLDKVSQVSGPSQEVKHELLQRTFKCLQAWAQPPALCKLLEIGIARILATIFDNLSQADYGRSEVMASILELLFIVEDMSDSAEGKIQCGKHFLFRLTAFVTASSKTPSLRLQRAVIETVCAIVTRSPENQQSVLDQKVQCYKLFKVCLPSCGDFQLQASLMEIFYRLSKSGPQLLQLIQDKDVKKSIASLIQSKKPNLLLEIRKIVTLLNESLGRLRSVYSFLAERILVNDHEMITDDKWINLGRAQLSFHISELPDSDADERSILDVQYEDIMELKRSSPTVLEILVQDRAGLSSFKESGSPNILRAQIYLNPADLSAIESSILPKIRSRSVGRAGPEGRKALNSHFIGKSTTNGSRDGPVNQKTVYRTDMNGYLGKKASRTEDGRLPELAQSSRDRNEKSSLDNIQTAPDFVSETPEDVDTLEEAALAKNSKASGSHAKSDCHRPPAAPLSSIMELYNPFLVSTGRPFPDMKENSPLQNRNTEPVRPKKSLGPPSDSHADANQSRRVAIISAIDGSKLCENDRSSKPSHLMTQNLHALSGPKTKSPSDAKIRARVCNPDSETEDEAAKNRTAGELRMKKHEDPHRINLVQTPESPLHAGRKNSVRNGSRQIKDAYVLPEVQRSTESSRKNPMTPPRDMPASGSVMTDVREKPASTTGKGRNRCRGKTSRTVPNCATGQVENGVNLNASRALRKRQCKKAVTYFDADDELTSDTSDSSTEFVATRQKKSRDVATVPRIEIFAKRIAQTTRERARRAPATAQEESRALTICRRDDRTMDNQQCGPNVSTSVSRKQKCSTTGQANPERKLVCTSNLRNNDVEDVFRFTANPVKEPQAEKTPVALSSKAKQNSECTERYIKKRKKSAPESYNFLAVPRQRSCTSDAPRPISVGARAQIMKSPPRAAPTERDEVTPEQHGQEKAGVSAFSRSSDTEKASGSPALQTRKTYSKSGRIITKNSRLERWRSYSIRKLELPKMDAGSEDESIDLSARASAPPLAKVVEEGVAHHSEGSSGIGLIAKLLKSFKHKAKLAEKKTVEDIMSNTMNRIQHEIRSAEEQIQGEKTEFMDACNQKCGQLDSQLQEQIEKMRALYDKFRRDFAQHLETYNGIGCKIEETELELNDLARQQGQDHRDNLVKLKESCNNHLADADQKIFQSGKSSTGMRSLKEALQGMLKDL